MSKMNVLYAAVGAPVVAAKAVNARLETLRESLETRTDDLGGRVEKTLEEWSEEGRQLVGKVSDGKMVDDLASKVDFDQAREQVGKLRDQLEEMLATWRTSFRPENGASAEGTAEAADETASGLTESEEAEANADAPAVEPIEEPAEQPAPEGTTEN